METVNYKFLTNTLSIINKVVGSEYQIFVDEGDPIKVFFNKNGVEFYVAVPLCMFNYRKPKDIYEGLFGHLIDRFCEHTNKVVLISDPCRVHYIERLLSMEI